MDLTVIKGGKFYLTLGASHLAKGLRQVEGNARNSEHLVESAGAVGHNGLLQALDSLTRMATSTITDGFPFPQLFVCQNMIIVCGLKTIYEWTGSALSLKYTASAAGGTWDLVEFGDYVYMSNGKIAVIRSAASKTYSLSTTQPHATAMCNYNGQVLIGGPDVDGLGSNLVLSVSPLNVTMSQLGTKS